jgi:hypothetical protein
VLANPVAHGLRMEDVDDAILTRTDSYRDAIAGVSWSSSGCLDTLLLKIIFCCPLRSKKIVLSWLVTVINDCMCRLQETEVNRLSIVVSRSRADDLWGFGAGTAGGSTKVVVYFAFTLLVANFLFMCASASVRVCVCD